MKRFYPILLAFFSLSTVSAEAPDSSHFGRAIIHIGDKAADSMAVQNAILYRSVSLAYDTTLQLKDRFKTTRFFYPQLQAGDHYVLHLILARQSEEPSADDEFYDVYFDLGDTLRSPLEVASSDSNIFLYHKGRFSREQAYSEAEDGVFRLQPSASSGAVEGSFDISFRYPSPDNGDERQAVRIAGELVVPEENVLRGEATTLASSQKRDNRLRQNMFIALITTVFIVLIALR